ncbi:MAG: hypothetical protein KJ630_19275 [Proteobacteria bacterium]|nr:hypothetical protein [Pseudomonadota bacterium]
MIRRELFDLTSEDTANNPRRINTSSVARISLDCNFPNTLHIPYLAGHLLGVFGRGVY